MAAVLAHRGPDDAGVDALDLGRDLALGLAHRRLSIIDLTSAGHQPMHLDGGRLRIVFNGEIYNYIELREELRVLGRRFETGTDTEVLLHAYAVWGDECLERLNGMWSFALWDASRARLFCAVDQCGIKPFYYSAQRDRLAFASEPKALLELPWVSRQANGDRVGLYLLSLVDQYDDQTMFESIRRLLPGHALAIEPGRSERVWRWWRPRTLQAPVSVDDAAAQFREAIRDSIRLRFRSDVPVGISLSGGIDSTGLVSTAADMAERGELSLPHGLRTFTATTSDPTINEGNVARRTAERYGATSFTVEPGAFELNASSVEKLVWQQDEPFSTLSIYMQSRVMQLVRETGTVVVLSGQGPDELFSGYAWQYPYAWSDLLRRGQALAAGSEIAGALRNASVGFPSLLGYALYAWAPGMRTRRYLRRVSPFLADGAPTSTTQRLLEKAFARVDGRGLLNRETEVGLPALLRYEDRNSMASSVESRLPYLDPRLLDLAYAVPTWMKIRSGWSKVVVRTAFESVAPPEILWSRRKIGFAAPQTEFMHGLGPLVDEVFSSGSLRSEAFVNPVAIRAASRNQPELADRLWRFLNLELWMRAFRLDASPREDYALLRSAGWTDTTTIGA